MGRSGGEWRPFIYGGIASIAAEFGTFPIDTTKTRLQVQGQKLDSKYMKLKYSGMTDAFVQISRHEGVLALYSGIWPAVLRQAVYGTIKFGTYYSLKKLVSNYYGSNNKENVWLNVGCAVFAGAFSSSIANPTDVLKVRMQIQGNGSDLNLRECFRDIYRNEGVRGLWRGVGPTAQRAAVIAAVELPVYDMCKHRLLGLMGDSVANHFTSSFIASLGSAIASTPIDVIRTRLMNQRKLKVISSITPGELVYKGTLDCATQTIRNEGFRALYKGFIPAWLRMGPWNIIFFITYEQLKKIY